MCVTVITEYVHLIRYGASASCHSTYVELFTRRRGTAAHDVFPCTHVFVYVESGTRIVELKCTSSQITLYR